MGFFDKLFGRKPAEAMVVEPGLVVFRRKELADLIRRPEEPNFSDEPQPPCEKCAKPVTEVFITTGGPLGDPELWRDQPIAVDGWACAGCGVFRYPRKIDPSRITAIMDEGIGHGQAGFAQAELCFARIVWNWPGYMAGHLNYAEATRERLHRDLPKGEQVRRLIERRMFDQYEETVEAFVKEPKPPEAAPVIARACITLAERAVEDRALDRARRFLATASQLVGVPEPTMERVREIDEYVRTRRDLFFEAANLLTSRIRLIGRMPQPPRPEERQQFVEAIEKLEEHLALDPDRWQSLWLYAKGLHLLGREADAFSTWARAFARHPGQKGIAQDYALELMRVDKVTEARDVARGHVVERPEVAEGWCNLALAELLCGDLDASDQALRRSEELDPVDVVARSVRKRLDSYRGGRPLPRTLEELERG